MEKINENLQVNISLAVLIKAMLGVGVAVGMWYQIEIKFTEQEQRVSYLEDKVTILSASVEGMEKKDIEELEEENRSLMERLGLSRKIK